MFKSVTLYGVNRFVFKENQVMFVGSQSPYYKHKPDLIKPVEI